MNHPTGIQLMDFQPLNYIWNWNFRLELPISQENRPICNP